MTRAKQVFSATPKPTMVKRILQLFLAALALVAARRGGGGGHGGHGGYGGYGDGGSYGFSVILPSILNFNGNLSALNATLYASSLQRTTASLLPCLSAEDAVSVQSCDEQEKFIRINNILSYYNGSSLISNNFCRAQCILEEFEAVNSTGSLDSAALEQVIRNTNLTDAQKTAAIATMTTCLATNGATVSTSTNNCFPGINNNYRPYGFGGRFKRRAHGGGGRGHHGGSHGGRGYLGMQTTSAVCRSSVVGLACLGNALSSQGCGTCAAAFYYVSSFSYSG